MSVFERNIEALRRRNPRLARELESAVPGGPRCAPIETAGDSIAIRVDGRLECSVEDPLGEARELAAGLEERAERAGAQRLVLFGLGVHVLPNLDFDGDLLVVEPDVELCRLVFEHVDLSRPLEHVDLIAGEDAAAVMRHDTFRAPQRGVFLSLPSTRRRARELHDQLAMRFHPGGVPSRLDIAVVPPLYGGSLPVAQACVRALRQLGHRVRELDLTSYEPALRDLTWRTQDIRLAASGDALRAGLVRIIGESLLAQWTIDPPDLVFALAQAPLDAETLVRVGKLGIPRALWFCEDFRVMTWWSALVPCYDVVFHVQPRDFPAELRRAGTWPVPLPMAFDPDIHRPLEATPEQRARFAAELAFVGAGYHNRREFLPGLADLGLRVWGTDWPHARPWLDWMPEPNQRQSSEDINAIFNCSTINLNLHSSPWCDGINPLGDYLNPRCFELAGAGAFQLVDWRSDLGEAFEPGVEIETFSDLAECRRKIAWYRDRPDERAAMSSRARERALAEHTYRQRMHSAIEALEAGPVPVMPRSDVESSVGAARRAVSERPELCAVLDRLDPDRELDGDAISDAVAAGEGSLSREEMLLLFLRESRLEVRAVESGGVA